MKLLLSILHRVSKISKIYSKNITKLWENKSLFYTMLRIKADAPLSNKSLTKLQRLVAAAICKGVSPFW